MVRLIILSILGIIGGSLSVSIQDAFTNDLAKGLSVPEKTSGSVLKSGITKKTVPDVIREYGYPVEIHNVTTADGYILQLHRIPYGKKCGAAEGKRVIFVQHGLLCDSSNWVTSGPDKSLAFMLADECYDVWLGNARGNTYSRRHVTFDPDVDKEAYWSYSFHEMGVYDLPANFDYIMELTGTDGLYYAGHSMGTTMFWICMAERPEYNAKIKLMNALAPVAHTEHMISPIRLIAPFGNDIQWLLRMIGIHEFAPSHEFFEIIGKLFCEENDPFQPVCQNVLFLLCGYNWEQVDAAVLPIVLEHLPAGQSVRTIVHYAQGVPSKAFRQFDHGREKNLEKYGQLTPPEYNFAKITAPTALYWGQNDWLGAAPDTHRIAELLPNIQRKHRVNHDKFNHLDFIIAKDMDTLLNQPIIEFMRNF